MLKGLDQVDWKSLDAEDVPNWLNDLTSQNKDVYRSAFSNLEERVVLLQEDTMDYGPASELLKTEAPIFIVPFLIQLLQDETVMGKADIIQLLLHLANYVDITEGQEPFRSRAVRVREAVRQGIETYTKLLSHVDPNVKMGALHLSEEIRRQP
jgi:hypothetical protein